MKINIGTSKGNIVGYKIDKKFDDISTDDIIEILNEKFGRYSSIRIYGWCKTPRKKATE